MGLPAQHPTGLGDVRLALLGIVLGQGLENDARLIPGEGVDPLRELEDGHLRRVADVGGPGLVAHEQPVDTLHQVTHVAEGAGLAAVPIDGQGLTPQGLFDEIRHHPPIVDAHTRPVGVEDAHDAGVHAVGPVIGHGHGLREAFGLVVDAPGADGIHVAPVVLRLGMHQGVAVDLAGAGQEETGALGQGQPQRVVGAQAAHLQRLDGQFQVVHRAGRAGKVEHCVQIALNIDVIGHIVLDEMKALMTGQVGNVVCVACDQVVHRDHMMALLQQPIAEMASQKPGSAGDKNSHGCVPSAMIWIGCMQNELNRPSRNGPPCTRPVIESAPSGNVQTSARRPRMRTQCTLPWP